jgi:hypothetical protein
MKKAFFTFELMLASAFSFAAFFMLMLQLVNYLSQWISVASIPNISSGYASIAGTIFGMIIALKSPRDS